MALMLRRNKETKELVEDNERVFVWQEKVKAKNEIDHKTIGAER